MLPLRFTARTGWRYAGEKIDVVNFQSFNSYLANAVGCTAYSFCARLGCSFDAIPRSKRIKSKDGFFRPEEYECHFRRPLQKTIRQPNLKRTDVWYVDPSGQNLKVVMRMPRRQFWRMACLGLIVSVTATKSFAHFKKIQRVMSGPLALELRPRPCDIL
jgi:hypothetical protein